MRVSTPMLLLAAAAAAATPALSPRAHSRLHAAACRLSISWFASSLDRTQTCQSRLDVLCTVPDDVPCPALLLHRPTLEDVAEGRLLLSAACTSLRLPPLPPAATGPTPTAHNPCQSTATSPTKPGPACWLRAPPAAPLRSTTHVRGWQLGAQVLHCCRVQLQRVPGDASAVAAAADVCWMGPTVGLVQQGGAALKDHLLYVRTLRSSAPAQPC